MQTIKRIIGFFLLPVLLLFGLISCNKTDQDDVYPEIDMNAADAFPKDCDTLKIGESFVFRSIFTDNAELGSYSLDIHNNFDHHTHSSSIVECPMDPVKTPVNPFVFIREFDIPAGLTEFQASDTVVIPLGVDPGDYHLMVRLTDREGWQAIKGISVKLVEN
jgi:hypothetical protein